MPRQRLTTTPDDATVTLTLKVPSSIVDRLTAMATDAGESRSEHVRSVLGAYVGGDLTMKRKPAPNERTFDGPCSHPVSRRIGKGCAACGKNPV